MKGRRHTALLLLPMLILSLNACSHAQGVRIQKMDASKALALHNEARAEVGTPPLVLSKKLSRSAQAYAEDLAKANSGLHHSENLSVGENLSMYSSSSKSLIQELLVVAAERSTSAWFEEKDEYFRLGSPPVRRGQHRGQREQIGHYVTMIWKETTQVGFGLAVSKEGESIYFVAHYSPPGNVIGRHPWKMD